MEFQTSINSTIKYFFFMKAMGTQAYLELVNGYQFYFNTVSTVDYVEESLKGIINNINITFKVQVTYDNVEFTVSNIPFKTDEVFYDRLTHFLFDLIERKFTGEATYEELIFEYFDIQKLDVNDDFCHEQQLQNYNAIMAILAMPEPTEAEEYLQLLSNPLAGLTEEKSWYRRQDTQKSVRIKKRQLSIIKARQIKQRVFDPFFTEYDDCSYS